MDYILLCLTIASMKLFIALLQTYCLPDRRLEDSHSLLAHQLALQYTILQEPAQHNILYSTAMKASLHPCKSMHKLPIHAVAAPDMATPLLTFQDFTSLAILLYECGYTCCSP